MKCQQNIGILNALVRITVGLTVLSYCSAKFVKKPWRESYLILMVLGAMKVAEGIVRFCPITALFQEGQCNIQINRFEDDWNQPQNVNESIARDSQ